MCGGYELEADPEALVSAFRVDVFPAEQAELLRGLGHEHFPRMSGPIVLTRKPDAEAGSSAREPRVEAGRATRWLGAARWGLVPHWATDLSIGDKLFNARAETLGVKPAFRDAFRSRRCVVPVAGFYEWRREGKRSQRFVFRAPDARFVALAGLWASWRAPSGEKLGTYTVITVPANGMVAPIHDRMPVVLSAQGVERWLALDAPQEELRALLVPAAPESLRAAPG